MKCYISLFIIILINCCNIYSNNNNKIIFRYEYPEGTIHRFKSVRGYEYASVFDRKKPYYQYISTNDSCVSALIEQVNLLEKELIIPQNYSGFDVDKQLILIKQGYGYDVLDFSRSSDGGYKIELNGKLMKKDSKWNMFIDSLIVNHQKNKLMTDEKLKEIIIKSGLIK